MKQDVHHHFIPEALRRHIDQLPEWNVNQSLVYLKENNLEKATLCLPFYEIDFVDKEEYVRFCHEVNLELRSLVNGHKGKFEAFAVLPFPYVNECLKELRVCLSYRFEGIVLYSNVKGVYPSSIDHEPLFRELSDRDVKVFIHPGSTLATSSDNGGIVPEIEEAFDVSRLVTRFFGEDAFDRFPGIRYVLGHGGGVFPYQFSRIGKLSYFKNSGDELKIRWGRVIGDMIKKKSRVLDYLKLMELDMFDSDRPEQISALRANFTEQQCLFGSNFPFGN